LIIIIMGVNNLFPRYAGGAEYYHGFMSFPFASERIVLDVAGLLFSCAIQHADSYVKGDYTPALQAFQRQVIYLNNTLRWDMVVVFDGGESSMKRHERARRELLMENADSNDGKIRNTPVYIALAAKICRESYIDYIIAAEEADPQCKFSLFVCDDVEFLTPTLVVTGDSDLIAYGNTKVMIVSS
jgi:5'-3' exonuclease